jgi:hypothetical protein
LPREFTFEIRETEMPRGDKSSYTKNRPAAERLRSAKKAAATRKRRGN